MTRLVIETGGKVEWNRKNRDSFTSSYGKFEPKLSRTKRFFRKLCGLGLFSIQLTSSRVEPNKSTRNKLKCSLIEILVSAICGFSSLLKFSFLRWESKFFMHELTIFIALSSEWGDCGLRITRMKILWDYGGIFFLGIHQSALFPNLTQNWAFHLQLPTEVSFCGCCCCLFYKFLSFCSELGWGFYGVRITAGPQNNNDVYNPEDRIIKCSHRPRQQLKTIFHSAFSSFFPL